MQEAFGETSYFNIEQSLVQSDLAAMAISDDSEEYNEYERFPRDGGNSSKCLGSNSPEKTYSNLNGMFVQSVQLIYYLSGSAPGNHDPFTPKLL
ncbi:hypothetical protein G5714_021052 [Onychostoma macrolepis]|uniref:Uncharacterized protein n=1 Tax=Onychostoma macrolepis TaxID=369639 RepID=A0A7J6BZG0_9TELE|nr:hypothetical protein G5714_021052 [Onychostoma macrolepis]